MAGPGDYYGSYGQAASSIAKGVDDVWSLFRGKTDSTNGNSTQNINVTNTTEEDVSNEKAKAYLQQLLGGVNGLAALTSGQKSAGIYDSTTNMQLTNDLLAQVTANVAALSKKTTTTQAGTVSTDTSSSQHKKGALEWIVCTELYKQGRMPHRWYRHGFKVFAAHSAQTKNGYYYWAVPLVKHLRKHPDSVLSAITQDAFNARAEYLAAEAGERTARKTIAGFLVKHITYVVCVVISRTIARKSIDWYSEVYKGV